MLTLPIPSIEEIKETEKRRKKRVIINIIAVLAFIYSGYNMFFSSNPTLIYMSNIVFYCFSCYFTLLLILKLLIKLIVIDLSPTNKHKFCGRNRSFWRKYEQNQTNNL